MAAVLDFLVLAILLLCYPFCLVIGFLATFSAFKLLRLRVSAAASDVSSSVPPTTVFYELLLFYYYTTSFFLPCFVLVAVCYDADTKVDAFDDNFDDSVLDEERSCLDARVGVVTIKSLSWLS